MAKSPKIRYAESAQDKIEELKQAVCPEAIDKLLSTALSRSGDFAEIYAEYAISSAIALEENKIRQAQSGIIMGVGIRVLFGERTGYAYSDSLEFEHLKRAAEIASHIAEGNEPGNIVSVNAASMKVKNISPIDIYPADTAVKDKSSLLWRANKAGYAADKHVKQVNASFTDSIKFFRIANSNGLLADNQESLCRLNVSVVIEKDNQRQSGYHGGGGRVGISHFDKFTPEKVANEAVRVARIRLEARDAPAGPQAVVLGNGWAGVLFHEAVGHGLEADFNRKRTSLYAGRIGQKVASDLCTIVDDGTIPNRRGSLNIDDEGAKTCRNILIENGVLKNYMTDYLNARLMNTQSTGAGRRESYRSYPLPRMTNTFMLAGESSSDEIIKSVKKGFYAKSFGGGQVDISNGQFVFEVVEGYLIENGKITAPVKGATLIGSGPEVLEKVVMVGNDFEFDTGVGSCGKNGQSVPVGIGMPTCKISEITIGGTALSGASLTDGKA
ncbi:MAG: metalloprotease TldD [candidate division Zixibacteria bacterium]|nr:metalloprotease TldD [candidate division Zixibacteria bacterium]